MENLGRDFDVFKDHLFRISDEVAARIKSDYPDQQRISGYLEQVSTQKNVKIAIYDVDGNKIMEADRRKGYGLNLELKSFTVVGRNVIYVVELVYPFSIENLGELDSFKKMRDAALVLFMILIGLLMVYLHFSLVRPLTALNRGLETVDYHNSGNFVPVQAFKRKDELGDLARKFDQMQRRLAASYQQQTMMMASISHDLKTPLTSIIGFIERLLGRNLPEEREREYLRIIQQKAADIQELITEFNDYVLSDITPTPGDKKETVSLKEFFESIAAEYSAELGGQGIDFHCYYNAGADLRLEIDAQKIRRVFGNLVNNALKYADQLSEIRFACTVRESPGRGRMAIFSVEDDGQGVPPDELAAIFDKFYRVDKSRSREKGGSGLGLAICQRIVESHGGTIQAYLNPEAGLGIAFTLPLQEL